METFPFKLVTPTGILFEGAVEQVTAVGPLGEFGVLAEHINLITSLVPGLMTIKVSDALSEEYLLSGGLVEVKDGVMTALAQTAELPRNVAPVPVAEIEAAEEKLSQMSTYDPDYPEVAQAVAMLRARRLVTESPRPAH